MMNPSDTHNKQNLEQNMESVSKQTDILKDDFISVADRITENPDDESERFRKDLKDLKNRVVDLSVQGISATRQLIVSNLETAKNKADQLAHYAQKKADKSIRITGTYIRENPYQSAGIALGIGFLLGKIMSRKQ